MFNNIQKYSENVKLIKYDSNVVKTSTKLQIMVS